jgi:hypothetical protein
LHPRHAIQGILAAMDRFPLVALGEYHRIQEMHDFITALLFHPAVPGKITDIVVECGNGAYQALADRFVLSDQPVARTNLAQIWRQNADPTFDAPVYEQVFRTVRAVNWMLPPARRIRVLLGGPPVTMAQVLAHPTNHALVAALNTDIAPLDTHYAAVVEREVLQKGRRALLIAGDGHLLRGLYAGHGTHTLNAATVLAQRHPGSLFVIDLLLLPPGAPADAAAQRLQATLAAWPRPALALLAGTWLGATTQSWANNWINGIANRAVNAAARRYGAQADAVLYLGPGETLTASQADPAIYHWGTYPDQLRRLSRIPDPAGGSATDLVAFGLRLAQGDPNWFAQFNA